MHRTKNEERTKNQIQKLKDTFSGVIGRVSDLCKVVVERFLHARGSAFFVCTSALPA